MPPFSKKDDFRRLHNNEMKDLVHILREFPSDAPERVKSDYRKYIKEDIHSLPRCLRSSRVSIHSGDLCSMHNGLNARLIDDIWSWLQHELSGAIGLFLYPVIMSGRLTHFEAIQVRKLEPVLQMWQPGFDITKSAPPGFRAIESGSKWAFQSNRCPACMLARIGSDDEVLFALFAGMVGRVSSKLFNTDEAHPTVAVWEKPKSKRIRFVRYWVLASRGGNGRLFEAGRIGMKMKGIRYDWKKDQRRRSSLEQFDAKIGPNPRPRDATRASPAAQLGFDMPRSHDIKIDGPNTTRHKERERSDSYGPYLAVRAESSPSVAGLRPESLRPNNMQHTSYVTSIEDVVPRQEHKDTSRDGRRYSGTGNPALSMAQSVSVRSTNTKPMPFMASTTTIMSYDGNVSYPIAPSEPRFDPFDSPAYDPIPTATNTVEQYRKLLTAHPQVYSRPYCSDEEDDATNALPTPSRESMYFAFGDNAFNEHEFEIADQSIEDDEQEVPNDVGVAPHISKPAMRVSVASTRWDDLY